VSSPATLNHSFPDTCACSTTHPKSL
jgi:hypothetical protein